MSGGKYASYNSFSSNKETSRLLGDSLRLARETEEIGATFHNICFAFVSQYLCMPIITEGLATTNKVLQQGEQLESTQNYVSL